MNRSEKVFRERQKKLHQSDEGICFGLHVIFN
jgi:hypothetical protein